MKAYGMESQRKGTEEKSRRCSSILTTGVILDHIAPPLSLFRSTFAIFSKAFFRFFHFFLEKLKIKDHH
jgi:hypothetical protein